MSLPVRSDDDEQHPLVPQPHGGALRPGNRGGGRPKDKVREKLQRIAQGDSVPFLKSLVKGAVRVRFVGRCPHCGKDAEPDETWTIQAVAALNENARARLIANEQVLKYGIGTQVETMSQDAINAEKLALAESFFQAVQNIAPDKGAAIAAEWQRLYIPPNGG